MPSGTVVAPLGASICPFALLLVGGGSLGGVGASGRDGV